MLRQMRDVIDRGDLNEDRLTIRINQTVLAAMAGCPPPETEIATIEHPISLTRRGHERKLILGDLQEPPSIDSDWSALFGLVVKWRRQIFEEGSALHALAEAEGVDRGYASRLLPPRLSRPRDHPCLCPRTWPGECDHW